MKSKRMVSWRRACKCKCGATTGRVVIRHRVEGNAILCTTAILYPGPVCDDCDEPWELEKHAKRPDRMNATMAPAYR